VKQLIIHVCFTIVIFSISPAGELFRRVRDHAFGPNQSAIQTSAVNTSQSSTQGRANVFTPELICHYDSKEFDPHGDYYILGRKPKKFREFDSLELAVDHRPESPWFKPIRITPTAVNTLSGL
jgi:hypothetical protein